MNRTCAYKSEDKTSCVRPVIGRKHFCSMHVGCDLKEGEELQHDPNFEKDFAALVSARDGNWRGFVFPSEIQFPRMIDFPVDAKGCQFNSISIDKTIFKASVDFSKSIFNETTKLNNVIFEDHVFFVACKFNGPVDISNVKCLSAASFLRSDFSGRVNFNINFSKSANINQVIFREGVKFSGWRNVTLSINSMLQMNSDFMQATILSGRKETLFQLFQRKLSYFQSMVLRKLNKLRKKTIESIQKIINYLQSLKRQYSRFDPTSESFRMFETEGQLQDVVFLKPDQTIFTQVDLANVYFRGTNLRGVRFLGVTWWQPKLKRNGLHDELFIRLNTDGAFRHNNLPVLEETCRNARVALEDNRCFDMACDFYVGEMEAARAQLSFFRRNLFSINVLYRFVSFYGTSVGVASGVLLLFYCLHLGLTLVVQHPAVDQLEVAISEGALRSFMVLVQQNPNANIALPYLQSWIDAVFRVLGLIQFAMIALAFRSRIKRH